MIKSAGVYWSDSDGLQVSKFDNDPYYRSFSYIGDIEALAPGVMSVVGVCNIGLYGNGYTEEAVSFIGTWVNYGRLGGVG